ncbi:MAG TPA: hypothetical protein VGP36_20860 [Mycobacteriales bacterium]|nr:hypothetical protein [Mycobacteriales bacterium]
MKETRSNDRLLQVMTSAGLSYKALARAVREESVRASHPVRCDHTAVSRWCEGTHPRARTTQFIAAVLSAKLDRTVTLSEIGLSETSTADRQGAIGLAAVSGLLAAAEECSTDVLARSGELGTGAISHLQERIVLLARSYNDMPSVQAFATARDLRAVTLRLVQTTHRPRHLADLYTVLGQATALMGSTAFDLGRWDAAAILARCSTEYADLAGHASLTAWAYGLRATVAFWSRDVAGALSTQSATDWRSPRPAVRKCDSTTSPHEHMRWAATSRKSRNPYGQPKHWLRPLAVTTSCTTRSAASSASTKVGPRLAPARHG